MKKIKLIILFILLAILMFLLYFINSTPKTQAQQTSGVSNISGTALIYNTGGIIYFSSADVLGGVTGDMTYGVQYNNGSFLGNAWSPEYGWIQFSGLTGNGFSFQGIHDTESAYDPITHSTVPAEWANGVISLSGFNGGSNGDMPYSVVFNSTTGVADPVNHWAWGGNVIGWIDFSHVIALPSGSPVVNLTANPTSMTVGSSSALSWLGSNLAPNGCVSSGGSSVIGSLANAWPVSNRPSSGTFNTGSLPVGSHLFSIKCLGIGVNSTVYSPVDTALVKVYPEGTCMDQTASNFGEPLPCAAGGDPGYCSENPGELQCVCAVDPTLPQCFDFCLQNPQICSAYCVSNPANCLNLCQVNQQICTGVKLPHYEEN